MRKTMIVIGIKATTNKKVCPQCQEYVQFSPNVYTLDGLNICCDACYKSATVAHFAEKEFPATQRTKEEFRKFLDYQQHLRETQ